MKSAILNENNILMNQRTKLRELLLINDRVAFDSRSMLNLSGLVPCLLPKRFRSAPTNKKFNSETLPNSKDLMSPIVFTLYHIDFIHKFVRLKALSCVCARLRFLISVVWASWNYYVPRLSMKHMGNLWMKSCCCFCYFSYFLSAAINYHVSQLQCLEYTSR